LTTTSFEKHSLLNDLPQMDRKKATKLVIQGLVIAIVFGTALIASRSIAANANAYLNMANQQNSMNYWSGSISYNDYIEQQQQNQYTSYIMVYQYTIVGNIVRIGVELGLVLMVIGFFGLAMNDTVDDRSRRIMLAFACLVLFVIMFTTFFTAISISIS